MKPDTLRKLSVLVIIVPTITFVATFIGLAIFEATQGNKEAQGVLIMFAVIGLLFSIAVGLNLLATRLERKNRRY